LRDGIPFAAIARFNIRLTDTVRTAITHISHRPWARPPTPHDHFSSVTSCTNDYDEHVALLLSSETFEFRLPHANTPRSPFVAPRAPMIAPARRRLRIHRAAGVVAPPMLSSLPRGHTGAAVRCSQRGRPLPPRMHRAPQCACACHPCACLAPAPMPPCTRALRVAIIAAAAAAAGGYFFGLAAGLPRAEALGASADGAAA
jgi:hypothetical protein